MEPEMIPVPTSTSVDEIGYDDSAQEVWVRFKSGRLYVYSPVPRLVWDDFVTAPSKGTFLNDVLKIAYPYRLG